jgi:hypothetical protein
LNALKYLTEKSKKEFGVKGVWWMKEKVKCLYCNEEINSSNESSEHIIQNAIFGRLESESICCKKCNSLLSKFDSEFCNQFSWITSISSPHFLQLIVA